MDYKLVQKTKVLVTDDLPKTILGILKETQYKRPLIVMDSFLKEVAIVKRLQVKLTENNIQFSVYDKVVSDPPTTVVDEGAEFFKAHDCDSLIAIGGGSAIDVARGINIVRINGGKISEYVTASNEIKDCPGLIAVPTTSGTGSELSNALIVTDTETQTKLAVLANNAVSEFAVLNPELVMTLPKGMTIATGLDAFSHAAEGYTSTLASPVTDAICEKIMYLLVKYLPKVIEDGQDREARERVMVAATLGGWMLNNAGTHAGHSVAHVIGSKYHMPHGMACAYALPRVLQFIAPVRSKKVKEIGLILGAEYPADPTDTEIGRITAIQYREFRDKVLGMKPFTDFNISDDELLTNIESVVNERFAGNTPKQIDQEGAMMLLKNFG
ncbi:iron-containing alcohol dehydrogenase [Latilactobacillus sakei]|uniref:iron-containing alcohol dehydrogenase n=1 Tax=Latilactobacillus sakei TaxID=1599 RepID=UPI001CFB856D|nr:iron-containing alcohol dehydrogenase [Latilactobacillus sakei]MCB4410016.1 iron-containing alcohol dehydrogenase [Latilactobacillus sakei]